MGQEKPLGCFGDLVGSLSQQLHFGRSCQFSLLFLGEAVVLRREDATSSEDPCPNLFRSCLLRDSIPGRWMVQRMCKGIYWTG